jgi:hypothetical protein
MRNLLITAPLVSKTWQALTLSPALQRALFFQSDGASSTPIFNPLLVEMFPPFFAPATENRWSWPGTASRIMSMPWSKAPDAFMREDASWRRMLVTQPPAQRMILKQTRHGRGGNSERRAVLEDLSLRMGVLYDLAVPSIDRVASSFCIRWHDGTDPDGDLILATIYTVQCTGGRRILGPQFYSDGFKSVNINFGEWVHRVRR